MTHLHTEKSPYLLQHIDNPVDWYPWSELAFERARKDNKLNFLSVGYSTCASLLQTVVLYKPEGGSKAIVSLAPFLKHMPLVNNRATAYVRQNFTCQEPLTEVAELQATLNSLPD